jgi:tol-pal system protein YbgF
MRQAAAALLLLLSVSGAGFAAPVADVAGNQAELNRIIQSQNDRIARLESQLQSQGLLSLLNQVEALKADVALLRGAQEEQAHRLDVADKRSKELFGDMDERIKEIASRPSAAPADAVRLQSSQSLLVPVTPLVSSTSAFDAESETKAYEVAHALIKAGKYKEAIDAFNSFLTQFPSGGLAANALYWIGFSYATGHSDFKSAAESYKRLLRDFPASPKAPDALLSLARAQIQLEDKEVARATLNQLLAKFPTSKAAENGKKLLATLK